MADNDSVNEDIYAVCPYCRGVALNSWSSSEKGDWTRSHITYKDCQK